MDSGGPSRSTRVLHFCKGLGSSTPVLQEQTRGLRTRPGSREASECSGYEGCEMLQEVAPISDCTMRYERPLRRAVQATTAAPAC